MIRIFTFASHRTDFIGLQLDSFRKHLRDEFEFVVFNNSKFDNQGDSLYNEIASTCSRLGVRCIDIQKDDNLIRRCQAIEKACTIFQWQGRYSNANVSHAYALCWAWENVMAQERQPIAIFDSDVFLIESISLEKGMAPYDICRIPDGRPRHGREPIRYMWPTFVLLNMATLPDPRLMFWYCGQVDGVPVDVAGQTHHYFEAHPELKVLNTPHTHFADSDRCPVGPADFDEFYLPVDGEPRTVFHYRSGSNWNHQSHEYHVRKTEWLKQRIG